MSKIGPFFNPVEWVKAYRFHKRNSTFDKSTYDLELYLYSKILNNNMLHWGYFENFVISPDSISLKMVEEAQIKYAENIIEQITDHQHPVLDVGCGMGGLAELMMKQKMNVEVLTPNKNQIQHIRNTLQNLVSHHCKFEQLVSERKYGTVINSESLQYIRLEDAFRKVDEIIMSGGKWIIVDYFRLNETGINKSAHLLKDFEQKLVENNWTKTVERDITPHVLPTIQFANLYFNRFLVPVKHYVYEKLRYKKGWLYYLTTNLRASIDKKITKEEASIDPAQFVNEKKYMFFVLQKNTTTNDSVE
ncbi:MAG: class I SAM-dependent methyltransferase [Paludibacter sp.]|nr:class I SAM-dependent methyltransferase [Paludibacter sp.]